MIVKKTEKNEYKWGEDCKGWIFLEEKDLSIICEKVPPGKEESLHFHTNKDQFFIVQSGELTIYRNSERFLIQSGEGIMIAKKQSHRVVNESCSDVEFILISNSSDRLDKVILKD